MGDPVSAHSTHGTTLRNKIDLEKCRLSYVDLHREDIKNRLNMVASPSKEEIVRHMSNLPSYLEAGKATPDRALSFGVMDWGRLEKWQYQHLNCSPSTSNSSSLFSTDGSTPQSSRGQSCSPARQKPHRATLLSHFNISSAEIFPPYVKSCLGNMDTGNHQTNSSSSKGKMKVQDEVNESHPSFRTGDHDLLEKHKASVLSPTNCDGNSKKNVKRVSFSSKKSNIDVGTVAASETRAKISSLSSKHSNLDVGTDSASKASAKRSSFSSKHSNLDVGTDSASKASAKRSSFSSKHSNLDVGTDSASKASAKRSSFSSKHSNLDVGTDSASKTSAKRSSFSSKNSNFDTGTVAVDKPRSMSPMRRFSFSMSSKPAASTSTPKRIESPVSQKLVPAINTCVSNRSHPSPLRRLLEPLFASKATNSNEDSKVKAKEMLDLRNDMAEFTSTTQAFFQTTVKNGRPLFTFALENDKNVLAATVKDFSCSGKDNINSWIYTFFTLGEVKKKNGTWLFHSRKDKGHSYLPNVTASMKVSNSNSDSREFSLCTVDPNDEVAAIVVNFIRNLDDDEENQERFSTRVILPGGNHGVSSNGKPSPLIERWRSGGVCDCGGWDLGCRLRILASRVQSSRRSNSPTGQFELFFQGDVINERRYFSLRPAKEGIYSVEYNSSLSTLQALSICISVMECRKSSQYTESSTYVAKQVHDDPNPVRFASFPPLSPVGRV
ncbi:hypothetical protein CTI12_AA160870 [Artemisia annua]|uniref:Uncharacterized protein n=1 Tax=Artemisia annua TaxID=35608 RepID=A0A2U1P802_ARTAN|nr:hypothetical protein CTI12_AA160870 [Artemisia annua]